MKSKRLEKIEKELNSFKGIDRYKLTELERRNEQLYHSFDGTDYRRTK